MSFDRLAPHYRRMERVLAGDRLQACRTAFLETIRGAGSILLLGEGHGRFLTELVRSEGKREVVVVDESAGMLEQARQSVGNETSAARVEFRQADALELEMPRRFDAVITHFFLDCFTGPQLARLIPKIESWIAPGGCWQVADFQVPRNPLLACRARLVLALAYGFFRISTRLPANRLTPPQPLLTGAGLARAERREFNFGLLYSELWRKAAS